MSTTATQLTITIPEGAPPGSILSIPVKGTSETIRATVPEGLGPGCTLVLTKLAGSDTWVEEPLESLGAPEQEAEVTADPQPNLTPPGPVAYTVRLDTTVGVIDIIVRPDWAPHGARRFLELAACGDLEELAFYRSVKGCLAQFGLPARRHWPPLPDDPPTGVPFLLGAVCFAAVGQNSRKSTLFICTGDMSHCFGQSSWETPIGAVAEASLDALDRIETCYGDIAECGGAGPNTGRIHEEGNAYLQKDFPGLTYIRSAWPIDWTMDEASRAMVPPPVAAATTVAQVADNGCTSCSHTAESRTTAGLTSSTAACASTACVSSARTAGTRTQAESCPTATVGQPLSFQPPPVAASSSSASTLRPGPASYQPAPVSITPSVPSQPTRTSPWQAHRQTATGIQGVVDVPVCVAASAPRPHASAAGLPSPQEPLQNSRVVDVQVEIVPSKTSPCGGGCCGVGACACGNGHGGVSRPNGGCGGCLGGQPRVIRDVPVEVCATRSTSVPRGASAAARVVGGSLEGIPKAAQKTPVGRGSGGGPRSATIVGAAPGGGGGAANSGGFYGSSVCGGQHVSVSGSGQAASSQSRAKVLGSPCGGGGCYCYSGAGAVCGGSAGSAMPVHGGPMGGAIMGNPRVVEVATPTGHSSGQNFFVSGGGGASGIPGAPTPHHRCGGSCGGTCVGACGGVAVMGCNACGFGCGGIGSCSGGGCGSVCGAPMAAAPCVGQSLGRMQAFGGGYDVQELAAPPLFDQRQLQPPPPFPHGGGDIMHPSMQPLGGGPAYSGLASPMPHPPHSGSCFGFPGPQPQCGGGPGCGAWPSFVAPFPCGPFPPPQFGPRPCGGMDAGPCMMGPY
eukprot:TRINITY_DN7357_c0_g1_i2.p1 TRINITY_DN7357_c0_g1~~TRINITY_DN7357_c0_g1_i2.p1  ORF type:complete len:847 (-),score=116.52 TRINITY_DN7357_c0_g1_i2:115-2655(-)